MYKKALSSSHRLCRTSSSPYLPSVPKSSCYCVTEFVVSAQETRFEAARIHPLWRGGAHIDYNAALLRLPKQSRHAAPTPVLADVKFRLDAESKAWTFDLSCANEPSEIGASGNARRRDGGRFFNGECVGGEENEKKRGGGVTTCLDRRSLTFENKRRVMECR